MPFWQVIYSVTPPGLFYHQPALTEGVQFTRSVDVDLPWRYPVFRDDYHGFNQLQLDDQSCFVFDVRHIKVEKKKVLDIQVEMPSSRRGSGYWAILPAMTSLFGADDRVHEKKYIASGLYQLPLLEGPVRQVRLPNTILDLLGNTKPFRM